MRKAQSFSSFCLFIFLLWCLLTSAAFAQNQSVDAAGHQWWQNAVFYEIYPRSFGQNNDGIGDLNGIASKLDYLKELGVDAIWIAPCFPRRKSISATTFPTTKTLTRCTEPWPISTAAKRGRNAASGSLWISWSTTPPTSTRGSSIRAPRALRRKRDWYIWSDGKDQPPNNWISTFGGSAWKFDAKTNQYYYHYFYPQQPDLNWRNPAVKDAMFERHPLVVQTRGGGFSSGCRGNLFEDPNLQDNPVLPGKNAYGDPQEKDEYNTRLPEVHDVLRDAEKGCGRA